MYVYSVSELLYLYVLCQSYAKCVFYARVIIYMCVLCQSLAICVFYAKDMLYVFFYARVKLFVILNVAKYDICAHTRCWFLVYIGERWKRKGKSTKNSETCLMSQRYLNWNFLPKSLLWVFLLVYSLQGFTIFFKHSTWAVIVVSIRLKFHALGITYAVF